MTVWTMIVRAVPLLSDNGVPLEDIARLVGHSGTSTTETVHRQQIRPVMNEGASVSTPLRFVTQLGTQ